MDSLDILAQGWSVMAVRSITSVASLYLSPVRALPTVLDGAHTPGLRGYVRNPGAFVHPWVPKDVVSNVSEIEVDFHESLNLVAAASQLGTSCYSLVIMRGPDPTRQGVLNATLVTQDRVRNTNVRLGTSDHQEVHPRSDVAFNGALEELALGLETGRAVWRFKVFRKLGLQHKWPPAATSTVLCATQSGPLLVHQGKLHPAIRPNSPNELVRNGVGLRADGHLCFIISTGPVSFYEMAIFFRDYLHCPNALYLDGVVSAIYAPNVGLNKLAERLGPVFGLWE